MCFHNSMSAKAAKLAARYGRKSDVIEIVQDILDEQYHVNAFNYPRYPIITSSDEIQVFNWGLIPRWVKTETDAEDIRKYTLNARADTIFEKPSYRESIRKRRCIVPSTGYFEWRHSGRNRIPYFIYLKDEPIFSMAGIYDTWMDKETGKEHSTFSLITTDANPLTAYIHNSKRRMPAILSKAEEEIWLDPDLNQHEIASLLKPFDADDMDAYVVRNDFIKKVPTDETILEHA